VACGSEGHLVRQVSVTYLQQNSGSSATDRVYTWTVGYTQLGSTPPITAPASATNVAPSPAPTRTSTEP
jgi:hypothetical protein